MNHPKCQHVLTAGPRKGQICGRKSLAHNDRVCADHDPTGRLTLRREWITALSAGECPHIRGKGAAPITRGHIRHVSQYLYIRVSQVHTNRDGWWITYTLHDQRPKVRNLRRTPTDHTDYDAVRQAYSPDNFRFDQLPELSDRGEHDAAEESAYTTGGTSLVADAGEAPPAEFVNDLVAGRYDQRRKRREEALERARAAARELRELAEEPGATGRERKHVKEIEHHVGQLGKLAGAA